MKVSKILDKKYNIFQICNFLKITESNRDRIRDMLPIIKKLYKTEECEEWKTKRLSKSMEEDDVIEFIKFLEDLVKE